MANKKNKSLETKTDKLVPVVFADSIKEAAEHCQLLDDHGIKAFAGADQDENTPVVNPVADEDEISHGVPVLVHKSDIDEAHEIISEREDLNTLALDDDEFSDDGEDDDDFGMSPDTGDDDGLLGLKEGLDEIL